MGSPEKSAINDCDGQNTSHGRGTEKTDDYTDDDRFFGGMRVLFPFHPDPPQLLTGPEARHEAKSRVATVLDRWNTLRDVIQRHEATIQRRWSKKSKRQKLKILLKAWPGMAITHRPDFDAYRKESQDQRDVGTKYKQEYLWPYINQEDLLKTRALPLLLNARGRHPPSDFAAADLDATAFGLYACKSLEPNMKFLVGYTMILNGVTESNIRDYGKILPWTHEGACRSQLTGKQFGVGDGLFVLEVQERLYSFLVECCRGILHDIPVSLWVDGATFPIQPEPELKSEIDVTGFDSLAVMTAETPYRVPAELDLRKIESLLAARASAAEDRLWALREDPLFLRDQLLQAKEHIPEQLNDEKGNSRVFVTDPNLRDCLWSLVAFRFVREVFSQLEVFSDLRHQAERVQALQDLHAPVVSSSEDLPDEYLKELIGFRFSLLSAARSSLDMFMVVAGPSPPLRHLFYEDTRLNQDEVLIRAKSEMTMSLAEEDLIWLLDLLTKTIHVPCLAMTMVDELERLLEAEPEAGKLVTSYSASFFGDLALLAQCLREINLYHPWARTFDSKTEKQREQLEREYRERAQVWLPLTTGKLHLDTEDFMRAVRSMAPLRQRFPYPIDKRRTRENAEALRKAEGNLDKFWVCVDGIVHGAAGDLSGTATKKLLSQNRALQRTPEWIDPTPDRKTKPATPGSIDHLYKPLSTLYFGLDSSHPTTTAPLTSNSGKIKTTGIPNPPISSAPTAQASATVTPQTLSPNPQHATIPVDARALKVFRALFHNPDMNSTPGEVAWTDFLHSMTATGFVVQKLYGSVWQFQPQGLMPTTKTTTKTTTTHNAANLKAIQFHEPHPKGKIPFWVARRYGRRLQRAYGWGGGLFVLREK